MASCPCCGDVLPANSEPDQLCPLCVRAMDARAETGPPGPDRGDEPDHPETFLIERPAGVTLIAGSTSFVQVCSPSLH